MIQEGFILSHNAKLSMKTLNNLRVQLSKKEVEAVTSSTGRLTASALFTQ